MAESSDTIDGKSIVVRDKTALPERCICTNLPVSEGEYTTWDLPYIPKWLLAVMLISPPFLLFAPVVVRRRCHVRAGLSRGVRRRFLLLKLSAVLLILLSPFCPYFVLFTGQTDKVVLYFTLFPFLFWGGFAFLILGTSPLRIVGHKGDRFWINGCSQEFLKGLHTTPVGV